LPRSGWGGATIQLVVRPNLPVAMKPQHLLVLLNGQTVGGASLTDGWQTVSLRTTSGQWRYGFNKLEIYMDYAAPLEGTGAGPSYSVAVDRISID
jgi:hypothetical protein